MSARFRESWRDAVRAVDRSPGADWRDRAVHHGTRLLVILAIAVALPFLFPRSPVPEAVSLEEGMVAPQDVIASFDVPLLKSPQQLARDRREAELSALPVYRLAPAAADSAIASVRAFFAAADSAFAPSGGGASALANRYGLRLSAAQATYLSDPGNRAVLRQSLEEAYERLLREGVVSGTEAEGPRTGTVVVRTPGGDRRIPRDSLVSISDFLARAQTFAPDDLSLEGFQLYQNLLVKFTVPSLVPDPEATRLAREQARAAVNPDLGTILKGERIVTAHERVNADQLARLRAYNTALAEQGLSSPESRWRIGSGSMLAGILVLGGLGIVLLLYRPDIYRSLRSYLIVMGLIALGLFGAAIIQRVGYPPELVPVVLVAVTVASLWDGLAALLAALVLAALVGALARLPAPQYHTVVLLAAGAVASLGVRGVRRRTQGWALIAATAGGFVVAGVAAALTLSLPVRQPAETLLWGTASATVYILVALGAVVPLLEKATGISTDQTLLELSDLNAPLLRELSLKAPGTYAHSINVANLAEAACTAIGANALLARAGVYYHDVGKMANPQFFVENQPKGRNPHDRLPPARSAAIIRDHVREGLRLAGENRLPPRILDFIREHHGTTLISFFWDRAREEAPDLDLNAADFAYPGPKPQSRETAVVMLADGIESATRVLQDPTPERIRSTIQAIFDARIGEGQLDQCPLTLRDLDLCREAFSRVLIGMYHRRIEYPSGVHAAAERSGGVDAEGGGASSGPDRPTGSSDGTDERISGPKAAVTGERGAG